MDIKTTIDFFNQKEQWASLFSGTGLDILKLLINLIFLGAIGFIGILKRKLLNTNLRILIFSLITSLLLSFPATAFALHKNWFNTPYYFFVILVGFVCIIFSVFYFVKDDTAMGKHESPIDKDIPEPEFKDRLERIAALMSKRMRDIDLELNWSMEYFTPLDAEVELRTRNGKQKKIADLLTAIKKSTGNLFLVIGEPGAGKSVSLRKLCHDLYEEVKKTGKLPIYINLKEWKIKGSWNVENNPPTTEELHGFVKSKIISNDPFLADFFDKYYMRMYETGRLYFIFDSFDEIPAVMSEKDRSPLIKKLSEVMYSFLKGARSQEAQGILASRIYRKPTMEFDAETTLEIRPFSEEKISIVLRNKEITRKIFVEKPNLIPIATNPLLASLIYNYLEKNNNQLPENQVNLFESYIHHRLANRVCKEQMEEVGIDEQTLLQTTSIIATFIFEHYGLEAPINELKKQISTPHLEEVIHILKSARLIRESNNIFSFVHRRFCEYFVVLKWHTNRENIDYEAIPDDTQTRDALVLYCGITDDITAKKIANFCWTQIKDTANLRETRALHAFRFLCDAFVGKLQCLEDFQGEFVEYLRTQFNNQGDIINLKLAVEGLCLTTNLIKHDEKWSFIEESVQTIFAMKNTWLNEIAIKACRSLPFLSKETILFISNHLNKYSFYDIFKTKKALDFSFGLSNALSDIQKQLKILAYKPFFILIWVLAMMVSASSYEPLISYLSLWGFISLMFKFINSSDDIYRIKNEAEYFKLLSKIFPSIVFIFPYLPFLSEKEIDSPFPSFTMSLIFCLINILILFSGEIWREWIKTKISNNDDIIKWEKNHINKIFILVRFILKPFIFFILAILSIFLSPIFIVYLLCTYIFGKDIDDRRIGLAMLSVIFFFTFMCFGINYMHNTKVGKYFAIALFIFLCCSFFFSVLSSLYLFAKNFYFYRRINFTECGKREYIENIFKQLPGHYRAKFLTYLENNVKEVSGEWTDKALFEVNNSAAYIRLAKLEEKWLGLDK